MSGSRSRGLSLAFVACATAASCGGGGSSTPPVEGQFVAFGGDFQGFEAWPSQELQFPSVANSPHAAGARTIFINHMPPAGASEFPVGTIIIKRTEADGQLLARAKRGGTYNPSGAVGWEWFELLRSTSGVVTIKWRGFGPPLGEAYGGDPKAGCNGCHKLAVDNDYVLTPGLALTGASDAGVETDAATDTGADAAAPDGGAADGDAQ